MEEPKLLESIAVGVGTAIIVLLCGYAYQHLHILVGRDVKIWWTQ